MTTASINVIQMAMNSKTHSVIHPNDDGSYTIVINSQLCELKKRAALYHELAHLFGDDFNRFEHATVLESMLRESNYLEGGDLESDFPGINFYFHVI